MIHNPSANDDTASAQPQRDGAKAAARADALTLKAKLFRGFADPSRLAIVEALRGGSRNVSEMVRLTGLSQSNASNHLACLLDCGLVSREQRGRFAYYRIADSRTANLLGLADEILGDVAEGVYVCPRYEAPAEDAPIQIASRRARVAR